MSNTIAIDSRVNLTEGFRLPDGRVGSFTFKRGPNQVPADVFGALRAKKNSVTEKHLELGHLVETSMGGLSRKMKAGTLEKDLHPSSSIQEATESKVAAEEAKENASGRRSRSGT